MKTKNGYDHWDLLNALSLYIHQQFLTYFGQPKLDLNYIKNRYLRDILSLGYYNQRNQTPGIGNKHAHLPGMMPESIIINFVCICFAVHVCKVVGKEGGGGVDWLRGAYSGVKSRLLGQIMRYQQADINVFCRLSKVTYLSCITFSFIFVSFRVIYKFAVQERGYNVCSNTWIIHLSVV